MSRMVYGARRLKVAGLTYEALHQGRGKPPAIYRLVRSGSRRVPEGTAEFDQVVTDLDRLTAERLEAPRP